MEKVAAVIVSYNRKHLLIECLEAIVTQSRPVDSIILIDNASTDGTPELLKDKGFLDNPLIDYVRLPKNTGGAGGFHSGLKRAFEAGYDWFWLMDEDGKADSQCLESLLKMPDRIAFRGPLILASEDPSHNELSFEIHLSTNGSKSFLRSRKQVDNYQKNGLIEGHVNPFNGVLLARPMVEKIGYPMADFFLWGDEIEYFYRAKEKGYPCATSTNALFYHPRDKVQRSTFRLFGKPLIVTYTQDLLRSFLLIRNHSYISFKYNGLFSYMKQAIKFLFYYRRFNQQISHRLITQALLDGLTGHLKRHAYLSLN